MRKIWYFVFVCMILSLGPRNAFAGQPANPGAYEDALLLTYEQIKAERQTIIEMNMELTKAEQKKFWPLYEEYQKALQEINDRRSKLIDTYTAYCKQEDCTDDQANQLISDYLEIENMRLKQLEKYITKFKNIIPVKKVIRYFQIENKLDAILNAVLSTQIPLMGS